MEYHNFYASLGLKPNSVKGLIMNLSAFFNWCLRSELISSTNFFKVTFGNLSRFPKIVVEDKLILSQAETEALIKAGANVQEKFMLAIMSMTAIRRGEVCSIKLSDISGCKITIHGKGDKVRNIFLDEILCTMLSVYMAQRDSSSEYLFYGERGETSADGAMSEQTVYNRVKSAGKRAGFSDEIMKKLAPHRLRGTAITRLVILYDLNTASQVAGHSSLNTTKIYDMSKDIVVQQALLGQRSRMQDKQN